jgi:hypothetical protein
MREADNLTTIYEPIAKIMWILNISQPYRPPQPVNGIVLLFYFYKRHSELLRFQAN